MTAEIVTPRDRSRARPQPSTTARERERLDCVQQWERLAAAPDLTSVCGLAAALCGVAAGFVSLVTRDAVKLVATSGTSRVTLPRSGSLCGHVIETEAALTVDDVPGDPRFRDMLTAMPQLGAYAGVPLVGRDGLPLGVLAVTHPDVHRFSRSDLRALHVLGQGLVAQIELGLSLGTAPVAADISRLRQALIAGELVTTTARVHHLETGELEGLEAGVVWRHPVRGLLGSEEFLADIEAASLVVPFERQVLRAALGQVRSVERAEEPSRPLSLTVRMAERHLAAPGTARNVLSELEAYAFTPERLLLSLVSADELSAPARKALDALCDAGVRVVVRGLDLGSAVHEGAVPLHRISLDGSTVRHLTTTRGRASAASVGRFAEETGAAVVAAGITSPEQREELHRLGIALGHGPLFAAPQPTRRRTDHALLRVTDEAASQTWLTPTEQGLPVLLIATEQRHAELARDRARRGMGPLPQETHHVDADEVLSRVVVDGVLDARRLRAALAHEVAAAGGVRSGVVVVSELAAVLWGQGRPEAAFEVEELCAELPVRVMCAYDAWPLDTFGTAHQRQRLHDLHRSSGAAPASDQVRQLPSTARGMITELHRSGASHHSIAAALNSSGYLPGPGRRWHWRQVAALLEV